ncbi:aldehyde dehydrogenase family protein, partial [Arthrobacter sp. EH-1B-1]
MTSEPQTMTRGSVGEESALTIRNPRDGSTVGTLESVEREQVALAVQLARTVHPEWAATAPAERAAMVRAAAGAL